MRERRKKDPEVRKGGRREQDRERERGQDEGVWCSPGEERKGEFRGQREVLERRGKERKGPGQERK